jgi:hypothetical protein
VTTDHRSPPRLKTYEDKLDAIVRWTVAIVCLDGKAKAYGDQDAAIWVRAGEAMSAGRPMIGSCNLPARVPPGRGDNPLD